MIQGIPGVLPPRRIDQADLDALVSTLTGGLAYAHAELHDEYSRIARAAGRLPVDKVWLGRALAKLPGWVAARAYVDGKQARVWLVP